MARPRKACASGATCPPRTGNGSSSAGRTDLILSVPLVEGRYSRCAVTRAPGIRGGGCLELLFTESLQIDRVRNVPTDPAELLRQRGYRVTGQRLTVLRAVYDVLGVLVDVGLIRRIQPAGSPARFEARVSDNHHHVICRGCGRVADVDCATGSAPCLTAVDDLGYEIDEAEVIYWGLCPECQSPTPR